MSKSLNTLADEIAKLIVDTLKLEDINPENLDRKAPLFGEGLGLDSIDALEIGAAICKQYGIKFKSQSKETQAHFNSVETIAKFVQDLTWDDADNPVVV